MLHSGGATLDIEPVRLAGDTPIDLGKHNGVQVFIIASGSTAGESMLQDAMDMFIATPITSADPRLPELS